MAGPRQALTRHLRRGLGASSSVSLASGPRALSPKPARRTLTTSTTTTSLAATARSSISSPTLRPMIELANEEEGWIWPVSVDEMMFVEGHKHGTRFSIPFFTLNSAVPLDADIMQRVLVHLHRKSPILKRIVKERDGQPWWYKPKALQLDFQVLEDRLDKRELIDQMFQERFDTDGPFWMARLIPAVKEDVCPIPELQESLPFQYYFSLIINHGSGDGTTIAFLCQKLLELLNDVIDGNEIDDDKQFGVLVSNEQISRQERSIKEQVMKDPEHFASLKDYVLRSNKTPALLKAFPSPQNVKPATKHTLLDLRADSVNKFLTNCKSAGITFGTGFQALINTATVEMVRDAGVEDESHDISVNMTQDLRRYMQPMSQFQMGLHMRTLASLTNTRSDVRKHFWEYARNLQETTKRNLKSKLVLEQEVVRNMVSPVFPQEFYEGSPAVVRDYGFNNLSDVRFLINGEGKHVQMTDLLQFTAVHKFLYTHLHQLFTFRDSCKYTISYATEHMAEDTVNLLAARVLALMRDFSR